jgi:Zinc finger, C3HC4 type (RING finger)
MSKTNANAKKKAKKFINAKLAAKALQIHAVCSSTQALSTEIIDNNTATDTNLIDANQTTQPPTDLMTLPIKEHWRSIKSTCKNYPHIYSYAKRLKADAKLTKKALKVSVRETRKQTAALLEYQGKVNKLVTCSICFDIYSQPHVLECGHVHCAFCLKNWIDTCDANGSCPTCRKRLSAVPIPSVSVQQLVDLLIEGLGGEEKALAVKRLMDDKLKMPPQNALWTNWIKTGSRYIEDNEDDVGRFFCLTYLDVWNVAGK